MKIKNAPKGEDAYSIIEKEVRVFSGNQTKIIVAKTMILAAESDEGIDLFLFTGYKQDKYLPLKIETLLGKRYTRISHEGIDTESLVGRKSGECSILVGEKSSLFKKIFVMENLYKAVNGRGSVTIVYPAGNNDFHLANGYHDIEKRVGFFDQFENLVVYR